VLAEEGARSTARPLYLRDGDGDRRASGLARRGSGGARASAHAAAWLASTLAAVASRSRRATSCSPARSDPWSRSRPATASRRSSAASAAAPSPTAAERWSPFA
jgi:hypothetical protein